jgi:hypothetical protein
MLEWTIFDFQDYNLFKTAEFLGLSKNLHQKKIIRQQ